MAFILGLVIGFLVRHYWAPIKDFLSKWFGG